MRDWSKSRRHHRDTPRIHHSCLRSRNSLTALSSENAPPWWYSQNGMNDDDDDDDDDVNCEWK